MKRVITAICLASLSFTITAFAQSPACEPTKKDPSIWDKSVAFGLNLSRGNSDTALVNLDGKISRDFEGDNWLVRATGNYGEDRNRTDSSGNEDKKTKQDVKAEVSDKITVGDLSYFGATLTFLYDEIADIDYRLMPSPAIGYYFIKDSEITLSGEAGPAYVFERVGGEDNDYLAPRAAQRFDWKVSSTAKFFESAEFLLDASDSQNTIVNSEAGIEAAIDTNIALVLSIKDSFDNIPAADKDRNDVSIISALKITL